MNTAVTAAEKAAIVGAPVYPRTADEAAHFDSLGPYLGHALDPRTPDADTISSLRYIAEDAIQSLYRSIDAIDKADSPEAVQRVIEKMHSLGRDLAGADWE